MAYLKYNGVQIVINDEKVCVTDIYNAAGKIPNKAPTNFKNSKQGISEIKKYERKYGTIVWVSKTGVNTIARFEIGAAYLNYLGDHIAAKKLLEVGETGKNIEYNNQSNFQSYNQFTKSSIQSSSSTNIFNIILGIVGILVILSLLFSKKEENHQQPYQYKQENIAPDTN